MLKGRRTRWPTRYHGLLMTEVLTVSVGPPLASVFHPLNAPLDPVAGVEACDRVRAAIGVEVWYSR